MATSSYDSAYRVGATTIAIPVGVTSNAVYFGAQDYLINSKIQYSSGGTCILVPVNQGATLAAATLAAVSFAHVPVTVALDLNGPSSFYLASLGATSLVSVFRYYSQGASMA